jgi:hypothetical protein
VDYRRSRPLARTWHRLETCVRRTDGALEQQIASGDTERSSTFRSAASVEGEPDTR